VIYFFDLSHKIFTGNFFYLNYLVTALYISTIQNPKKTKKGFGYLIIHPASTTFQKFQYGVFICVCDFWGKIFFTEKFFYKCEIEVSFCHLCRLGTYRFLYTHRRHNAINNRHKTLSFHCLSRRCIRALHSHPEGTQLLTIRLQTPQHNYQYSPQQCSPQAYQESSRFQWQCYLVPTVKELQT